MANVIITGKTAEAYPLISDKHQTTCLDYGQYSIDSSFAQTISDASGYAVLPNADPFLVTSLLVDKQYASMNDPLNTYGKPVIIVHSEENPHPAVQLVRNLQKAGMVKQPESQLYTTVATESEVPAAIDKAVQEYENIKDGIKQKEKKVEAKFANYPAYEDYNPKHKRPLVNIAVFCSASTKNQEYLDMAFRIGQDIAEKGYGIVFGAGNVAMMGNTAKGAKSIGGYVDGHTTPIFYEEEFIKNFPKGDPNSKVEEFVDKLHFHPDIYVRMKAMLEHSDALVVEPGGLGTVQELFAAFHVNKLLPEGKQKEIIFLNHEGYYNDVIQMAKDSGLQEGVDFIVANNEPELSEELDMVGLKKIQELGTDPNRPNSLGR